jgi:hypothetical protein
MALQTSTNQYQNTKYIVDAIAGASPYATIQSAINAAVAASVPATIFIRAGSYTENLTLYDGIELQGSNEFQTIITGVHVPPIAGRCALLNLGLASATHILSSAAAGAATLKFSQCKFNCTNGYVCNVTNWTGAITFEFCSDISTANGLVLNTATASVTINNCTIGKGAANAMTINGVLTIFNAAIGCPVTLSGAAVSVIDGGSSFLHTMTISNTANVSIANSRFSTGADTAIIQNSSVDLLLSDVNIESVNANAINGTGAVQASLVSFSDSYGVGTTTHAITGLTGMGIGYMTGAIIEPFTTAGVITNNASGVLASTASIGVPLGGTGLGTMTDHSILLGSGVGAVTPLTVGAVGEILVGVAANDPAWSSSPTITGTTTSATLRTGDPAVLASIMSLNAATITMDGTGASVGLTITPKGSATGLTVSAGGITATAGAITATSGNVVVTSGNLTLPNSTSSIGQIQLNSIRYLHNFGTAGTTGNLFLGYNAGNFTLTAASALRNIGIGTTALSGITTGTDMVTIGYNSGAATYGTVSSCVFIGSNSGTGFTYADTNASGTVAIGYNTCSNAAGNSHSTQIVAIGYQACKYVPQNATGIIAIGYNALSGLSTSNGYLTGGLFIGNYCAAALNGSHGITGNLCIGNNCIVNWTNNSDSSAISNQNTFIGTSCAAGFTTAISGYNTFVGASSGATMTTGNGIKNNVFLGYGAGNSYTTTAVPSNCICIGYNSGGTATEGNILRIGNGTGTSDGNIKSSYISGIYTTAATPSGTAKVVLADSNDLNYGLTNTTGALLHVAAAGTAPIWSTGPTITGTMSAASFATTTAATIMTLSGKTITMSGSDTDVGLVVTPKNAGGLTLSTGTLAVSSGNITAAGTGIITGVTLRTGDPAAVAAITSITTNTISALGTGAAVNLVLTPKGTGVVSTAANVHAAGISFDSGTTTMANYSYNTWTPTVQFGGASVGITYAIQIGQYWRIGNIIHCNIQVTLTSKGSSVGAMSITGLPVTPASNQYTPMIGYSMTYSGVSVVGRFDTTGVLLIYYVDNAGGTLTAIADTHCSNSTEIKLNAFYFV